MHRSLKKPELFQSVVLNTDYMKKT